MHRALQCMDSTLCMSVANNQSWAMQHVIYLPTYLLAVCRDDPHVHDPHGLHARPGDGWVKAGVKASRTSAVKHGKECTP